MNPSNLILLILLMISSIFSQEKTETKIIEKHNLSPRNGPILHLPFNGNAKDHSGYNNHGKVLGPILTTDRFGEKNRAYLFDGNSSRIEVSDKKELRLHNTDFTISLWCMEMEHHPHNNAGLVIKRGLGSTNGWFLGSLGKRKHLQKNIIYSVSAGSDPTLFTSDNSLELNQWHHIVLVYQLEAQEVSVYCDNKLLRIEKNYPSPNKNTDAKLVIGFDIPTQNYGFNGKIDDIVIYSRALDLKEIELLNKNSRP